MTTYEEWRVTGTQLCIAPTCRIRGRHLPDCADADRCAGCLPRVAEEGVICAPCLGRAAAQLEAIADLAVDARDVAHRLSGSQGVGGSGKPGSRLPLDLGALARLDAVGNALGGWVRVLTEERGLAYKPRLGNSNA